MLRKSQKANSVESEETFNKNIIKSILVDFTLNPIEKEGTDW